jgi:hypothetical protein
LDGEAYNSCLEFILFSSFEWIDTAPAKNHRPSSNLLNWFDVAARDLPWRRTRDPHAMWISEFILQDMDGQTVNSAQIKQARKQ